MPHLKIEYSANLEPEADMGAFCETLRAAAAAIPVFPTPGIRVRAYRADHVAIADGSPRHAFVDIVVRLREGRSETDKAAAAETLFDASKEFFAPLLETRSLALSLELCDIDDRFSPKTSTIRRHLS